MTNPIFNPQPNYSGVTIQITNPAVNVGKPDTRNIPCINSGLCGVNQNGLPNYPNNYVNYPQVANVYNTNEQPQIVSQPEVIPNQNDGYPNAYPAQYYLNNYNYSQNLKEYNNENQQLSKKIENSQQQNNNSVSDSVNSNKVYSEQNEQTDNDMTKSDSIKNDLAQRESEIAEKKKNTKEEKIVALTDEYIKSLENYLNNPNDEIRLMASKEILTRLDEDKDRYDDAALNALLNKMLQDPNKLVRIAGLSALSSQLASGNDFTVKLLQNIQSNPNSDKEDVLQAADILLKMSAGIDVKKIPDPSVKEKKEQ